MDKPDVDPRRDDDASPITNVGLILTKLTGFQLFSTSQKSQNTSQNSISNFFEKDFNFMGFHVVVLVKTFPLMYQLLL